MSLEKLFTKTHEVKYNGVDIAINDVTLKEAPTIAKIISQITGKEKKDLATSVGENIADVKEVVRSLVTVQGKEISKEDIDKISIDAILFIIAKIVKLNISFLKKTIIPMAKEIQEEMKADGLKPHKP